MFKYLLLTSILALIQLTSQASSNAPWKNWTFCKKPDPTKNSDCLVKAIQGVEKDLVDGSSYFGLPRLHPLHIDELSMYQAGQDNRAAAVNITFVNCDIYNLQHWTLSNAKANWDNGELSGTMSFRDTIVFDADYTVNGKIILLPVRGKGKSKITFENMEADLAIKGKKIERKGKEYFTVDKFDVTLRPKRATFHFGNILGENTALSEGINRVLNENWKDVMEDVKQPVGKGLGAAFKLMSQRIFSKIPFDVLVPK